MADRTQPLTDERYAIKLEQQRRDWEKHLAGARQGNPYATLCQHCFGRHSPPHNELCPHESIADLKARLRP